MRTDLERIWLCKEDGDTTDDWNEDVKELCGGVTERQVANCRLRVQAHACYLVSHLTSERHLHQQSLIYVSLFTIGMVA